MSGQSLKDRLALYPYEADGRKPARVPKQFWPRRAGAPPSVSVVRMTIKHFIHNGESTHSGNGMLLPYVIEYCEREKIEYVLMASPGLGYYIQKKSG